ncbi:hypothetical protein A3K73_01085 [Candidatus Pacearchaeota archaeon RBG_13_36_9]|nr:MAG: hypothetical protein A3K73_01085 [Candidatus Pacearchaeota archaeon RBG_13_36_9]
MANSITNALRKFMGIKKEGRKSGEKGKKKVKRNSKENVKSKEKKKKLERKNKSEKNTEKEKKKLKELRLSNLEKAREKRSKQIEKERKKEEKLNKLRLKNLEIGREKRMKQITKEKKKEEGMNKLRLKNLEKAREARSEQIEKEKKEEKKLNKLRVINLEKAKKRRKEIKQIETKGLVEQQFVSYEESVPKLLHLANFEEIIKHEKRIILKPNLTIAKAFPVTTDPSFVEEIIKYIRKHSEKAEIIIAEGSGGCETKECFKKLGYEQLSEKYHVPLLDLNEAETVKKHSKKFKKYSFIECPGELLNGFLISLPVLKGHKEAKVTISLKNMLGCFPARYYGGNWKVGMHKWPIEYSIHDILVCKMPDYAICDASIALLEHEINGYPKEMSLLLAGNPLKVDKKGALLLGYDWKRVPHLVLADELEKNESGKIQKI